MSLEGLLPQAKQLAQYPNVEIYRHMIEQIDKSDEPRDDAFRGMDVIAQAGTICDLNAYLLMVTAAGVERIEKMKAFMSKALDGKNTYEAPLNVLGFEDGADRARCFQKGEEKAFGEWMTRWSQFFGHGVVQFKFEPGPHTFIVERVPFNESTLVNNYRVYQGYEGVYRLADFLGLANDGVDEKIFEALQGRYDKQNLERLLLDRFLEYEANVNEGDLDPNTKFVRWTMTKFYESHYRQTSVLSSNFTKLKEKTYETESNFREAMWNAQRPKVKAAAKAMASMAKTIGRGNLLSWGSLQLLVVNPLAKLLAGGLPVDDLQKLTGVPTASRDAQLTRRLVVLTCDRVSPEGYATNFQKIKNGSWTGSMTEYVLFDP